MQRVDVSIVPGGAEVRRHRDRQHQVWHESSARHSPSKADRMPSDIAGERAEVGDQPARAANRRGNNRGGTGVLGHTPAHLYVKGGDESRHYQHWLSGLLNGQVLFGLLSVDANTHSRSFGTALDLRFSKPA